MSLQASATTLVHPDDLQKLFGSPSAKMSAPTLSELLSDIAKHAPEAKRPDEFTVREFVDIATAEGRTMTVKSGHTLLQKLVAAGTLATRITNIGGHQTRLWRKC